MLSDYFYRIKDIVKQERCENKKKHQIRINVAIINTCTET